MMIHSDLQTLLLPQEQFETSELSAADHCLISATGFVFQRIVASPSRWRQEMSAKFWLTSRGADL